MLDEFESPRPLRRRIGRLFENFVGAVRRPFSREPVSFVPPVELKESESEYVMKADLPGMREQDIDLRIDDENVLTISGERQGEETKRVRGYEYTERSHGSFSRTVQLPPGIDASKIEADLRSGVLEIHIPKTAAAQGRKIPVSREEPRVIPAGNGPAVQKQQV